MPIAGNMLKAIVTADVSRFQRAMKRVEIATARTAKKSKIEMAQLQNELDKTATSARLMAGILSTIVVAALYKASRAFIELNKQSIDAAKNYESLRLRLQILAGDQKKGAQEFNKIKKFAEESAFATIQVGDAYVRLRAVTGRGFASEQIENIAFASRVAGTNIETMAARVGELVLRIKSGLTGGLLARSLRTFGTAFGEEATLDLVKMAQAGESSEIILKKVVMALGRIGIEAKRSFSLSAEGLEAQGEGLRRALLAEVGDSSLSTYKDRLIELNSVMTALKNDGGFETLKESFRMLNEAITESVRAGEFKQFLQDVMTITSAIAGTLSVIIKAYNFLNKIPSISDIMARPDVAYRKSMSLFGLEKYSLINDELSKTTAKERKNLIDSLKKTEKNTGVVANGIDPQKLDNGER